VRRGKVGAIEEIFDVQLGAQTGVEPEEERGVETDEAREADRVIRRGEEFVAVDRAETEAPLRVEIVAVPEREGVARRGWRALALVVDGW
jgi:hypothetical protein